MTKRYVNSSERALALARGLVRYANWMNSNQQPGNIHHDYWVAWEQVWGEKMSERVRKIHDENFTWATHYTD